VLEVYKISCPYCGEEFESSVDLSAGGQQYFEDCYVCCRPIQVCIEVDHTGELASITTKRDDE